MEWSHEIWIRWRKEKSYKKAAKGKHLYFPFWWSILIFQENDTYEVYMLKTMITINNQSSKLYTSTHHQVQTIENDSNKDIDRIGYQIPILVFDVSVNATLLKHFYIIQKEWWGRWPQPFLMKWGRNYKSKWITKMTT